MSLSCFLRVAFCAGLLIPAPAWAQLDHADLHDFGAIGGFAASYPGPSTARVDSFYFRAGAGRNYPPFVSGGRSMRTYYYSPPSQAFVQTRLYEPDSIQRTSSKAVFSQKSFVRMRIHGYVYPDGEFNVSGLFAECRAKALLRQPEPICSPVACVYPPPVRAFKLKCGDLGLSEPVRNWLKLSLGLKKIKYTVEFSDADF